MSYKYFSRFDEQLDIDFDETGLIWLLSNCEEVTNIGKIHLPEDTIKEIEELFRIIEEFNLPF